MKSLVLFSSSLRKIIIFQTNKKSSKSGPGCPSPTHHPFPPLPTARSHEDGAIGLRVKENLAILSEAEEHPRFLRGVAEKIQPEASENAGTWRKISGDG